MNHQVEGNYLRTHRKQAGLSQREVGHLLGYKNQWQVSRHERGRSSPSLLTALAYEAIFRAPVSSLFARTQARAARSVEVKLVAFGRRLNPGNGKGRVDRAARQKLAWLTQRTTP
jgi:DNA-binding XRE family transcriptional regulator